jgi:hypothetical protein
MLAKNSTQPCLPGQLTLRPGFSSLLCQFADAERALETNAMAEKPSTAITRREFARRAAIASAVATLSPVRAVDAGSSLPAAPAQQPAGTPKLSPESQAEVDARVQAIFSQYGSRFSEDQKADIRRLCAVAQPPLDRLRAYAVENGDNPALYLKPLVEREKNPATSVSAAARRATSAGTAPPAAKMPAATAPPAAKTPAPGAAKKP